jgi:hypothetical protein
MTIVTPHATPTRLRSARSRLRERAHDRVQRRRPRVYTAPMRLASVMLVLVGCGNVTAVPDAPPIDMPPDMFLGAHRHYVVDHQTVPVNNTEARANTLDLNGDATPDNQLGGVFAALAGQGFDFTTPTSTAVDRGTIIVLVDLQAPDLATAAAAVMTTYLGANPQPPACNGPTDGTCRHHLDGTATFALSPASPHEPPLAGAISGGVYTGGPGKLPVQIAPFGPTMQLELVGARAKLADLTDTTIATGIIAGGIRQSDIDTTFIPQAAADFEAIVQRDCPNSGGVPPDCGCAAGAQGKTLLSIFDASPQDCRITEDEVRTSSLIQSLLAPDLTIEGQPALSFGFGFTAVRGEFTSP